MKKLIASLVVSLFAGAAFAQQNGLPPTQPPAGVDVPKLKLKKSAAPPAVTEATSDKGPVPITQDVAPKTKRAARQLKRAEKVGDKPLD